MRMTDQERRAAIDGFLQFERHTAGLGNAQDASESEVEGWFDLWDAVLTAVSPPGPDSVLVLDEIVEVSPHELLPRVSDILFSAWVFADPVPNARWLAERAASNPRFAEALRFFPFTAVSIGQEAEQILAPWTNPRFPPRAGNR